MKLKLEKKYKSLDPFECELPDFTILTGVNGAGKTQILTGLISQQIELDNGEFAKTMKYIPSAVLSPTDRATITSESFTGRVRETWNIYNNFVENTWNNNSHERIEHYIGDPQLPIIKEIAKDSEKDIYHLERLDFYKNYPMDDGRSQTDLFYHTFSALFKRYKDKYTDNEFDRYLNQIRGLTDTQYLNEETFFEKWGERPWDFLNKLNEAAGLQYRVNSPIQADKEIPFELSLINTITDAEVSFEELSSGEKTIMSLALALYNTNFEKGFPKILLLDEPDSTLHPSMTKHFLKMVQNLFVREKRLKIILTTHSPSTIALAEEDSIYIVNPHGGVRIEKSSKDRALKILTEGVPSFSVNYENRRQVFVESPFDVQFYEKIYRKLSTKLNPEISLSFISSGDTRTDKNGQPVSNCEQVIKITDILRSTGNKFVWGIIDYDNDNTSTKHIKVLGDGKRYSIESYLLDPILIAGILIREKFIERKHLGLTEDESLADFKILTEDRLQILSDFVIATVRPFATVEVNSSSIVTLVDGRKVEIPDWYLKHQGHELESALLKAFPKLESIKRKSEELLKMAILDKVADDVPGLLSSDFVETFRFIQD